MKKSLPSLSGMLLTKTLLLATLLLTACTQYEEEPCEEQMARSMAMGDIVTGKNPLSMYYMTRAYENLKRQDSSTPIFEMKATARVYTQDEREPGADLWIDDVFNPYHYWSENGHLLPLDFMTKLENEAARLSEGSSANTIYWGYPEQIERPTSPYRWQIMRQAYLNLRERAPYTTPEIEMRTTHRYVTGYVASQSELDEMLAIDGVRVHATPDFSDGQPKQILAIVPMDHPIRDFGTWLGDRFYPGEVDHVSGEPLLGLSEEFVILLTAEAYRVAGTAYSGLARALERQLESEERIFLGRQLPNPYAVENMRAAYNDMQNDPRTRSLGGSTLPTEDIEATHLYVRFLPANEEQLQLLRADSTLALYEYPLDYDVPEGLHSYHDPTIPTDRITWQYTSVSPDYDFPNVRYEILAECYIPDEDESDFATSLSTLSNDNVYYPNELERRAFARVGLSGMFEEEEHEPPTAGSLGWHPNGRIQVWDDLKNDYIPVPGVEVRARQNWFAYKTAYTNEDGYFYHGEIRGRADYSIRWESDGRNGWDIRKGYIGQATYNGPKVKGAWNKNIGKSEPNQVNYAHIHRACYRMYKGNILNLARVNHRLYPSGIKLCYFNEKGTADYGVYGILDFGLANDIRIYRRGDLGNHSTDYIFATTVHELAHAAHGSNIGIGAYDPTARYIKESWATFVEKMIARLEYSELLGYNPYDYMGSNYQFWKRSDDKPEYSPLFIDIYDNVNQRAQRRDGGYSDFANYVNDDVHYPNITDIQRIVFTSLSVADVKAELMEYASLWDDPNLTITNSERLRSLGYPTTIQVENLFEFY